MQAVYTVHGTPTKRKVTKRQVSKRPVSKRLKRQVYNRLQKNIHVYSALVVGEKTAGSVAAMLAGKVMAVFYSLF